MKQTLLLLVTLACFASLFAQTNVQLDINHKLGTTDFGFNIKSQNSMGHEFDVTRLEYYISQITLTHDGGQVTPITDLYLLIDASQATNIALGDLNVTDLEKISFYIGVDGLNNHKDPALWASTHPLAPKFPSMHWGWSAGYRFIAYEGNSGTNLGQLFQLHGLGDNNYFKTEIDLPLSATNGELTIALDADYARALENIALSSGVIEHGETGAARTALQNFQQYVFSPASPSTSIDISSELKAFSAYPNPTATGSVNIAFEATTPGEISLEITDALGRRIYTSSLFADRFNEIAILPKQGIYFATIYKDGTRLMTKKLISQ